MNNFYKQHKHEFIYAIGLTLFFGLFIFALVNKKHEEYGSFTGYLVAKEYIPEHYEDEYPKSVYFFVMPYVHKKPRELIKEQYIWYIANKDKILRRSVDKDDFHSKELGEKITLSDVIIQN